MIYLVTIIGIILITACFFKKNIKERTNSNELFSTKKFTEKENIKSAKCPQCGKIATTYSDVKKNFGLRKVGYATDIQSWCRKCRRNKNEIEKNKLIKEDLTLFDE